MLEIAKKITHYKRSIIKNATKKYVFSAPRIEQNEIWMETFGVLWSLNQNESAISNNSKCRKWVTSGSYDSNRSLITNAWWSKRWHEMCAFLFRNWTEADMNQFINTLHFTVKFFLIFLELKLFHRFFQTISISRFDICFSFGAADKSFLFN